MSRGLGLLLILALWNGCGSPPSRPESLWGPAPAPGDVPARQEPATVWQPPEEGEPGASAGSDSGVDEPEVEGTVVLNEIYYDAVGSDTDGVVFVELYGTPALNIGGYRVLLVDGGDGSIDDKIVLPDGARIPADGFYLIADAVTGDPLATRVAGVDLVDNFDPQNGPDAIQLVDRDGRLVDAVAYGEGGVAVAENGLATGEGVPAPDVAGGHSLERREPGVDLGNNIEDFVDQETPTPGLERVPVD